MLNLLSVRQDAKEKKSVNRRSESEPRLSICGSSADGPGALIVSPQRYITQTEFVPPEVEHLAIEVENAVTRHARGSGHKHSQSIEERTAFMEGHAGKQVPQGEGVAPAGRLEHSAESGSARGRTGLFKVERGEGRAEGLRRVLEVRRARPGILS